MNDSDLSGMEEIVLPSQLRRGGLVEVIASPSKLDQK